MSAVHRRSLGALVVVLTLLSTALTVTPASAGIPVEVKITIERIRALDSHEEPGDADWYVVVTIDGHEFDNKNTVGQDIWEDDDEITPDWTFSRDIDSDAGSIPVRLELWDEDGGARGDDDPSDINPGSGVGLPFTLQLVPCALSGISGDCDESLVSAGDRDDDHAEITFRVEVIEPVSAPGLNVRCMHSQVWPAYGFPVTITAEVLDGALAPKLGDTVEIWVDDRSGPDVSENGVSLASFTTDALTQDSFSYGCRVIDDGVPIFTGWRTVTVGRNVGAAEAIPVLLTGPRKSSIDIVFVADRDDYESSDHWLFILDVKDAINKGYWAEDGYGGDAFLTRQNAMNFWIASELGQAEDYEDGCDHEAPEISWQDVGAILHRDPIRDCAPGGQALFSSEPFSPQTLVHETGHRPFGLADEYCCDGGYHQTEFYPNLHSSQGSCDADAGTFAPAGACSQVTDGTVTIDWFRTEPSGNDLMEGSGQRVPQAADTRRIGHVFAICQSVGC